MHADSLKNAHIHGMSKSALMVSEASGYFPGDDNGTNRSFNIADNSGDPRIAYSINTLKILMVLSLQINAKLIILLLRTPHFQSQFLYVLSL